MFEVNLFLKKVLKKLFTAKAPKVTQRRFQYTGKRDMRDPALPNHRSARCIIAECMDPGPRRL